MGMYSLYRFQYLRGGAVDGHVFAVQIPVFVVEQNRLVFVALRQKLNV